MVVVGGGAVFAALRLGTPAPVEVPTARAQRGEFVISVKGRGEIKSARSVLITAPQTPESRIVRLAVAGKPGAIEGERVKIHNQNLASAPPSAASTAAVRLR